MRFSGKLKTLVMSSALAGVMAAAPLATHAAELGDETLHQGMTDQDVKPLQRQLKDFDYYDDKVDGSYGPITFDAVSAFQKDYGLLVDGIFGPKTFDALKKVESLQDTYKDAPVLSQGDRGKVVKDLQSQLKDLNYYGGDLDGIYGPRTSGAVKDFQQTNDISVDGMAGPETYKALIKNPVRAKTEESVETESATKVESASTSNDSEEEKNVSRNAEDEDVRVLYAHSTAYTANCEGCSGVTYTGINLNKNPDAKVIAVDPDVIPLGSTVWVEGYGYAVAGDIGSAIDGKDIDVFFSSRSDALNWGVKTVKVKVFE
ncbi:MAG TPA: peptidoglycan-binding protein [Bacillales bacterium]|nr:peptidoglycan-binding protein [Bacillales bacterium]